MLRTLTVNRDRYEAALKGHFLLATEIADFLVTRGVPFRDAHHVAGRIVAHCEGSKINLTALSVTDLLAFHASFDEGVLEWLDPRAAAERRTSYGGTATVEIRRQVAELRAWLG